MEPNTEGIKPPEKSSGMEIITPKKGTNIIVPVNNAEIFTLINRNTQDAEPVFGGVLVRYKGQDGSAYSLKMESSSQIAPTEVLRDAPSIVKTGDNVFVQTSEKGKLVPLGTPILETTEDNTSIKMTNEVGEKAPVVNPDLKLPVNFDFLKDSSGKIITTGK